MNFLAWPPHENLFRSDARFEKPGNLGAILRTCDAINVSVIILTNHKCDIFNPNVIRSSLGAVFSKLIITMRSDDAYTFFKKK